MRRWLPERRHSLVWYLNGRYHLLVRDASLPAGVRPATDAEWGEFARRGFLEFDPTAHEMRRIGGIRSGQVRRAKAAPRNAMIWELHLQGLTQCEIGQRVDCDQSTVSRVLNSN